MDQLGLMTLREELRQDCRVASDAAHLAQKRFEEQTDVPGIYPPSGATRGMD